MLDIKLLRDEPERITENLRDRNVRVFTDIADSSAGGDDWAAQTVTRLAEMDANYRALVSAADDLRREQNENSEAMKQIAALPKDQQGDARKPLIEAGRTLRERERELSEQTAAALQARDAAWALVPNLTHPDTPRGNTDDDHAELRQWGTRRDFPAEGFAAKDHLELAEALDLVDFAAGAKVVGQKFYYLVNEAVLLDMALQRYALEVARKHGFKLHTTPDLARV